MTRNEQLAINDVVDRKYTEATQEFHANRNAYIDSMERLRSCTAWVYETPHFYLLQSYSTLVAVIDKRNDTCYDYLRKVYGYTTASAQHIAKFRHEYGRDKWGCEDTCTWRNVNA